jgi:hypothetical protein
VVTDYDTYNKGLYTDQSICSKMEDENIQGLTDYIQTRCFMTNQNDDRGESPTTDLSRIEMDNINR